MEEKSQWPQIGIWKLSDMVIFKGEKNVLKSCLFHSLENRLHFMHSTMFKMPYITVLLYAHMHEERNQIYWWDKKSLQIFGNKILVAAAEKRHACWFLFLGSSNSSRRQFMHGLMQLTTVFFLLHISRFFAVDCLVSVMAPTATTLAWSHIKQGLLMRRRDDCATGEKLRCCWRKMWQNTAKTTTAGFISRITRKLAFFVHIS